MPPLHIRCWSPAAQTWLQQTRAAAVLHVFPQACNLINARQEILSLLVDPSAMGPFGALVETADVPFDVWITAETSVVIDSQGLQIGSRYLTYAQAELWHSSPPWDALTAEVLYAWRPFLERQAQAHTAVALPPHAERAWDALTLSLAGLGPGLTPAGDDFLMGVVYALWSVGEPAVRQQAIEQIVPAAVPRTTSLSGAWLRAAGRGEAGAPWYRLVAALADVDEAAVAAAVDRILQVGHTSGADALAGFAYGLYCLKPS